MVENRTTACKWDTVIPFAPLWEAYKRVIKPNGAIVLFGSQPFTSALVMSNAKWFRHEWSWDKKRATGGVNAKRAPMKAHENILVFGQNAPTYNPQMTTWDDRRLKLMRRHDFTCKADEAHSHHEHISPGRESCASRGMYPVSVIRFPALGSINSERTGHPTQKPVALLEYLIRTYTNEGDTVLDSCMGSASTAIACMRTGRKFIGIEKDPDYFEVSCQRVKDEQRQGRLFTV